MIGVGGARMPPVCASKARICVCVCSLFTAAPPAPRAGRLLAPFAMAAAGRAKCMVTETLCDVLVNQHIAAEKIGARTAVFDDDEFVEEFSPFLAALAQHTIRVIGDKNRAS